MKHNNCFRTGLFVSALIFSAASCGQGDDAQAPEVHWSNSDLEEFRVGTLSVPMDYSDPYGATVDIEVMYRRASGTRVGSLVSFQGGPGGSVVDLVAAYVPEFADSPNLLPLRDSHDLIFVNQRGVGETATPITCSEAAMEMADPGACIDELAQTMPLATISTANIARDADVVREALGIEHWSVYGVSYGTSVAQEYLRRFPERADAVVLDGSVSRRSPLLSRAAPNNARSLAQLWQQCSAAEECAGQVGDVAAAFERLLAKARAGNWTIVSEDDLDGSELQIAVTEELFLGGILGMLADTSSRFSLPFVISQADAGNETDLANVLDAGGDGATNNVQHFSLMCNEWYVFDDLSESEFARLEQEQPFGVLAYLPYRQVCPAFVSRTENFEVATDLVSDPDVPVLLVSGENDPRTPPEWGAEVSDALGNAQHVVFPFLSHGVIGDECADALMAAFVLAPDSALDMSCLKESFPQWPVDELF